MIGLLHNYRIFTTEVVAIIRHISKASWRVYGIDWRVEQRQSTERRPRTRSAHICSVFGALRSGFQRQHRIQEEYEAIVTWAHSIAIVACKTKSIYTLYRITYHFAKFARSLGRYGSAKMHY
jgi:hypothetical protein